MQQKLKTILEESKRELEKATSLQEAEETRIKVLGQKGSAYGNIEIHGADWPRGRERELGQAANKVRAEVEKLLAETVNSLKEKAKEAGFKAETIDVTEPGKRYELGTKHPITITMEEISKIFKSMGFSLTEGPEVETVFNNFDALNAGPYHPSSRLDGHLLHKRRRAARGLRPRLYR